MQQTLLEGAHKYYNNFKIEAMNGIRNTQKVLNLKKTSDRGYQEEPRSPIYHTVVHISILKERIHALEFGHLARGRTQTSSACVTKEKKMHFLLRYLMSGEKRAFFVNSPLRKQLQLHVHLRGIRQINISHGYEG